MKVKDWISSQEIEEKGYKENRLGGLGGWFNGHYMHDKSKVGVIKDHTWEDYLDVWKDELMKEYAIALKESILERELKYTGNDHQNALDGIPLFDDDTYSSFSFRAWGDLMAAIYTTPENPLTYMEYYC